MRSFLLILLILFSFSDLYPSSKNLKEIQFISGVILLNSKSNINDSIKTIKFNELKNITGITAIDALSFIEKYRGNAEEWKNVANSIEKLMNDTIPNK